MGGRYRPTRWLTVSARGCETPAAPLPPPPQLRRPHRPRLVMSPEPPVIGLNGEVSAWGGGRWRVPGCGERGRCGSRVCRCRPRAVGTRLCGSRPVPVPDRGKTGGACPGQCRGGPGRVRSGPWEPGQCWSRVVPVPVVRVPGRGNPGVSVPVPRSPGWCRGGRGVENRVCGSWGRGIPGGDSPGAVVSPVCGTLGSAGPGSRENRACVARAVPVPGPGSRVCASRVVPVSVRTRRSCPHHPLSRGRVRNRPAPRPV